MIDMALNNFTTDRTHKEVFFERIIKIAAKETDLESKIIELSINLVGEGRIKALNKKYRHRNRTTDVLSFPLHSLVDIAKVGKGPIRTHTSQGLVTSNGVNAIINLGDIFICLPVAKKRAKQEGVTLDFKMAFLTVHGFLHLLGYDHEKSEQAESEMLALQQKILDRISF